MSTAPPQPSPSLDAQTAADSEVVRRVLDSSARLLVLIVANVLIAVAVWEELPAAAVATWGALVVAHLLLRRHALRAAAMDALPLPRKLRLFVAYGVLAGVLQAVPLLGFPWLGETARAYLSIILMGLSTGTVASCTGHPRLCRAYCIPVLGGLVVAWLLSPSAAGANGFIDRAIGVLILLFMGILGAVARNSYQTLIDAHAVRLRERELNARLQEALAREREAGTAKTRFLASASHDLRQPLHTLSMLAATLVLRPLDERSRAIATLMAEVSESLNGQLDGLLDISRLDAGVVRAQMRPTPLQPLLQRYFAEVEAAAREAGITARLHWRLPQDLHVQTDPALLLRVLRNLVGNALKFTPRGGRLCIDAEPGPHGEDAVLKVADDGIGIAPAHQAQVFQEFFQVGNDERDRSRGLGLGLSIVARLAALMGIAVTLDSALGQGSCFTLRLPAAEGGAAATEPLAVAAGAAAGPLALNVLVVDDEKDVRTSTCLLLAELGCDCRSAADLAQAEAALDGFRPDLVLADFRLGGNASGLHVLAAARRRRPGLPVALVSGDTAPDRLREAEDAGVRLLHKPLSLAALQPLLDEAAAARGARPDPA